MTPGAKIAFSGIIGDEYEKYVTVTDHGHHIGELCRGATVEDMWAPDEKLRRELETVYSREWMHIDDAMADVTAAADVHTNRAARLRDQRIALGPPMPLPL